MSTHTTPSDVCVNCGKSGIDHRRSGCDSFACPSFKATTPNAPRGAMKHRTDDLGRDCDCNQCISDRTAKLAHTTPDAPITKLSRLKARHANLGYLSPISNDATEWARHYASLSEVTDELEADHSRLVAEVETLRAENERLLDERKAELSIDPAWSIGERLERLPALDVFALFNARDVKAIFDELATLRKKEVMPNETQQV